MQIGIYGSGTSEIASKTIKKILSDSNIESFTLTKSKKKHADCIIVLGGDKGVRNYFHGTFDSTSPVLIEDSADKNSYYVIMPMKI